MAWNPLNQAQRFDPEGHQLHGFPRHRVPVGLFMHLKELLLQRLYDFLREARAGDSDRQLIVLACIAHVHRATEEAARRGHQLAVEPVMSLLLEARIDGVHLGRLVSTHWYESREYEIRSN